MQDVLFVLGAGASKCYGYPTGRELRTEITDLRWLGRHGNANWDGWPNDGLNARRGRIQRHGKILEELGKSLSEHAAMAQGLLDSGCPSIDTFVSTRPEFAEHAKLSIATALLSRESCERLVAMETPGNWYEWLWNALVGTASNPSKIDFGRIHLFTFNYDRSLEAYLFRALRARFNLADDKAVEFLSKVHISHAYGQLSDIGAFCNGSLPFAAGHAPAAKHVSLAASNLRLIPELRVNDSSSFGGAQMQIAKAKIVCFLGYGFDQLNDSRLGLSKVLALPELQVQKTILATSRGLRQGEVELARQRSVGPDGVWATVNDDCLDAVRHWSHMLLP